MNDNDEHPGPTTIWGYLRQHLAEALNDMRLVTWDCVCTFFMFGLSDFSEAPWMRWWLAVFTLVMIPIWVPIMFIVGVKHAFDDYRDYKSYIP